MNVKRALLFVFVLCLGFLTACSGKDGRDRKLCYELNKPELSPYRVFLEETYFTNGSMIKRMLIVVIGQEKQAEILNLLGTRTVFSSAQLSGTRDGWLSLELFDQKRLVLYVKKDKPHNFWYIPYEIQKKDFSDIEFGRMIGVAIYISQEAQNDAIEFGQVTTISYQQEKK